MSKTTAVSVRIEPGFGTAYELWVRDADHASLGWRKRMDLLQLAVLEAYLLGISALHAEELGHYVGSGEAPIDAIYDLADRGFNAWLSAA